MAQVQAGMKKPAAETAGGEVSVTRVLDAPLSLVWKVWTSPEFVRKWWGPAGYTCPVARVDLRVGGKYLYGMRSPQGTDQYNTGTFREIVPDARIVCTVSFSDAEGNIVPASRYGLPGRWPAEVIGTITFGREGGKTRLTVKETGIPAEMVVFGRLGWEQSLDKLKGVLVTETLPTGKVLLTATPGQQVATVTRIFNAPPGRVWEAITDPGLFRQWWAPNRYTVIVDRMDVRPGGSWRAITRDGNGQDSAFHGVYHEVTRPARLVQTFEYEGMPGHVMLQVVTLDEAGGGRTKMTEQLIFESEWDRDGMLKTGLEESVPETTGKLAKLVEEE